VVKLIVRSVVGVDMDSQGFVNEKQTPAMLHETASSTRRSTQITRYIKHLTYLMMNRFIFLQSGARLW
jgi:hypothetical protein